MGINDIILFAHPTFGVLGTLAAVWLFVEALNANEANRRRIWIASLVVAGCMLAVGILAGYWYTTLYGRFEQPVVLKGPWPWAHSFFMETKEHLFFIPLILALYLPFVARLNLFRNSKARAMVMVVSGFVVLNALYIEGAGAIVNYGVKVNFIHTGYSPSGSTHAGAKGAK